MELAVTDWVTVLVEFSTELLNGGGRVNLHQSSWGLDETLAGGRVAEGSSLTVIVDQSTQWANLNILTRPCFLQDDLVVGVDDVTQFVDREVNLPGENVEDALVTDESTVVCRHVSVLSK